MNNLNYPKITIQIEGKKQIRDEYVIENFLPKRIVENTLTLSTSDSFQNTYSFKELPLRKFIISAPVLDKTVELPYSIQLKTTIIENVTGSISFIEEIESNTIKSYSEYFGSQVLSIDVMCSASDENAKEIKTRAYCWEG